MWPLGYDKIPAWFFKQCSYEIAEIITYITNKSISKGQLPDNWKISVVTPVPKTIILKHYQSLGQFLLRQYCLGTRKNFIVHYYLKPVLSSVRLLQDQFANKNTGSANNALIQTLHSFVKI